MDGHSAVSNGVRGVCRYFASKGECYYGNECQYLHQNPRLSSSTSSSHHRESSSGMIPVESKLRNWMPSGSGVGLQGDMTSNGTDGHQNMYPHHGSTSRGLASRHYNHMPNHMMGHTMNYQTTSSANMRSHVSSGAIPPNSTNQVIPHTHLPIPPPSYYISEDIRLELLRRQALTLALPNPHAFTDLPLQVDDFQDLIPIEDNPGLPSSTFGHVQGSVYKATHTKTGDVVCLRRIHSFQPSPHSKALLQIIEGWKKLFHSNLVSLKHVFMTKDFGDSSLVFVYDYFPGSQTLNAQYFAHSSANAGAPNGANRPYSQQQIPKLLPEPLIWSYIIQLSSALRVIHSQGLACRSFDPTKIILTNGLLQDPQYVTNQALQGQLRQQPRLRLSGCGIADVLFFDASVKDSPAAMKALIMQYQQEDLLAFGKVCLALACNSAQSVKQTEKSLEMIGKQYSADLKSLIMHLLYVKQPRNINDIMPMIGARFYAQLDLSYQRYDIMSAELYKEMDNSRLFRILCKLSSICERPEHRLDPQWAETGDRYLVKLFRDFLFHQVIEDGRPWMDLGHVITHLNKLEQGSSEKVCLISRDEQNVLIVSYAELKKCFDASFHDLLV